MNVEHSLISDIDCDIVYSIEIVWQYIICHGQTYAVIDTICINKLDLLYWYYQLLLLPCVADIYCAIMYSGTPRVRFESYSNSFLQTVFCEMNRKYCFMLYLNGNILLFITKSYMNAQHNTRSPDRAGGLLDFRFKGFESWPHTNGFSVTVLCMHAL